jgi:hypothetical protein
MSALSSLILAEPGLVSYYRLGEASGTFADSADTNPSATVGATVAYGHTGLINADSDTCAAMASASSYITIANAANLRITGTITIEAWIKVATMPSLGLILANGFDGSSNNGCDFYVEQDSGVNGHLRFIVRGGGASSSVKSPPYSITQGSIYHVVVTYDDSSNTVIFYINGVAFPVTGVTTSLASASVTAMTSIGQRSADGIVTPAQNLLLADFDEVALYNTVLSQASTQAHYSTGSAVASPDRTKELQMLMFGPGGLLRMKQANVQKADTTIPVDDSAGPALPQQDSFSRFLIFQT